MSAPEMHAEMLIRKPAAEVFQAFVDPAITTRFWYTKSSGPLAPGAEVRWEWEMYGASTAVRVTKFEENSLVRFEWNDAAPLTVEFHVTPRDDGTHVQVTESGYAGDGDAVRARIAGSTGGFTIMLCAMKALLEHGIELNAVPDAHPDARVR
jgi:uncharacterized protein YndB with AHSA1/START domain